MITIAANKKANFDYFIKEKYESGIILTGSEVKSLRINTGSIKESYVSEKKGELWLINCHIKKVWFLGGLRRQLLLFQICMFRHYEARS